MRLTDARNMFIRDMLEEGRIKPGGSERAYYDVLSWHAEDVGNRDPRTIGREDVKRTLRRWPNPNTQRNRRSILVSFYRWTVEEGYRKDNPAEQTRRPKRQPTSVYRMTAGEASQMLIAAKPGMETWAINLGLYAGLRRNELRNLRGYHLARPGFVWVSPDIAKGGRERWVPLPRHLDAMVADILAQVEPAEFVLCGQAKGLAGPSKTRYHKLYRDRPMSATAVYDLVSEVAKRAGIHQHIHPHLLRHAYGDHITKRYGLRVAQELMGHADSSTTEVYLGRMTPDELAAAVTSFEFAATPLAEGPTTQSYRYGDSNPGDDHAAAPSSLDENEETSR